MVEPAPADSEEEVKLSIIKPAVEKPAPVGVGGRKEGDDAEAVDDAGALDTPAVPPSDEG
jgi:ATP-dependent Clp protease ATP-binding subunit ClpC